MDPARKNDRITSLLMRNSAVVRFIHIICLFCNKVEFRLIFMVMILAATKLSIILRFSKCEENVEKREENVQEYFGFGVFCSNNGACSRPPYFSFVAPPILIPR